MSYTILSVKVPETLHKSLKKRAAQEEKTMLTIVQQLIEDYLNT